jgi:phenylacetate-CoA ligase
MIAQYRLDAIVATARQLSPFYRDLYAGLPERPPLERLPVVDQKAFWAANTQRDNRLLTGPMRDGVIFKSGGTTGEPKFSVYSRVEWDAFTAVFGMGLDAGGLSDGDRVANLFYAGDLYSSFVFIMRSLDQARAGTLQLPLSGRADADMIEHVIGDFDVDTLAGVPTTLMNLAAHYIGSGRSAPGVRRLLFGGESLYADQRAILRRAFPNAHAGSVGYASVDAGMLGYADPSCGPDEHRVFSRYTCVELLDEATGEPIEEEGRVGRVVVTNLTRLLMPILRYPAGDLACWAEPAGAEDRKFRLMGRSEEGARVGPATLYVEDVRQVLRAFRDRLGATDFQMLVDHEDHRDRLTLRVGSEAPVDARRELEVELVEALHAARPMLSDLLGQGMIHPLRIEWVALGALEVNARSGKLKRVIDRRHERR